MPFFGVAFIALLVFADMTLDQTGIYRSFAERGFTRRLLVGGKGDDLYKTLSKGKQLKPTNCTV
jgi:hypothetical protein